MISITTNQPFFLAAPEDYVVYGDEDYLLPDFPLDKPAAFQILESDCKLNESMLEQLRFKFYECENTNANAFIMENLNKILTEKAASVFSWTGNQGNIPVMRFTTMKLLTGSCDYIVLMIFGIFFGLLTICYLFQIVHELCVELRPRKLASLSRNGSPMQRKSLNIKIQNN